MQIYRVVFNPFLFFTIIILTAACGPSKKMIAYQGKVDSVISESRNFLGTPYKYGGINSKGIDCSGLILNSYKAVDMPLPRSAKDQSKVGKKVKVRKLKEGDLVFFAMGKKKREITHVGMVTDVESDKIVFIHASSSLGVVEKNLMQEYYLKRLRKSRRVLKK
ncbi:MAG: C40 family peptidase [Cyclobacteriaceae bacterium]|nr:C40 family peptidase [Cyclobacteriaceae bacterium]